MVVLVALFAVSDVYLIRQTSPPAPRSTAMTIDVIGHQWWWEVRYPGTHAVTANEIHIPADTRVNVVATTADVIHSFWVPALNRKIDMIPGRQNRVLLYASRARACIAASARSSAACSTRTWRCTSFAQTPAAFRAWLAQHGRARAARRRTAAARAGRAVVHDQPVRELPPDRGHAARRARSGPT